MTSYDVQIARNVILLRFIFLFIWICFIIYCIMSYYFFTNEVVSISEGKISPLQ